MLSEQLRIIKQAKKVSELKQRGGVQFADTSDMDDDLLLELVPFKTPYTGHGSLRFQRDMLTSVEESSFRPRMADFLRSSIVHMREEGAEYFLEYMCRKYLVHTLNPDDLAFLVLPFRRFYDVFVKIPSTIARYFQPYSKFSYAALASLFLREEYVRDFVLDYFEYYGADVEVFLKSMAAEAFALGSTSECSVQELVRCFEEKGEHSFLQSLMPADTEARQRGRHAVSQAKEQPCVADDFERALSSGRDRVFVHHPATALRYFEWVLENGRLGDSAFSLGEINFVRGVLCSDVHADFCVEDIARIFTEISFKLRALQFIYRRGADCTQLFRHLSNRDKSTFCSTIDDEHFILSVIDKDNYALIARSLSLPTHKRSFAQILARILRFPTFSLEHLGGLVTRDTACTAVTSCLDNLDAPGLSDSVYVGNIIDVMLAFDMHMADRVLAHGHHFARYLARTQQVLTNSQLEQVLRGFSESKTAFYVEILAKSGNRDAVRAFVSAVGPTLRTPGGIRLFTSFVERHMDCTDVADLCEIVARHGYALSAAVTRRVLAAGKTTLRDVVRSVAGNTDTPCMYEDLPAETRSFVLCLLSGTVLRSYFRTLDEAVPLIDVLFHVAEACTTDDNSTFMAELCLHALSRGIAIRRVSAMVLESASIFRHLPEFRARFCQVVDILVLEGLERRRDCVSDVFGCFVRNRDYCVAHRMLGALDTIEDRWVADICACLTDECAELLLALVERFDPDLMPFLPQIAVFCAQTGSETATRLATVLVKRYGCLLHPHLPVLVARGDSLLDTLLERVETRLLLKSCVEAHCAGSMALPVKFVARCLAKMHREHVCLPRALLLRLCEFVQPCTEHVHLCMELLKHALGRPRCLEDARPLAARLLESPDMLLAVAKAVGDLRLAALIADDIVQALRSRDYRHMETFCLLLDLWRAGGHKKGTFETEDLVLLAVQLLGDIDCVGHSGTRALLAMLSASLEVMEAYFAQMATVLGGKYTRTHVRLLADVFGTVDGSESFARKMAPFVTLILNSRDAETVSDGRALVRAIESRVKKPIYMLFD